MATSTIALDLGASKRGAGIQSGCAIHYSGRDQEGGPWARVEFVPAGEQVLTDRKWALARLITEGRTVNTNSPEFIRYVTETKLPTAGKAVRGNRGNRP